METPIYTPWLSAFLTVAKHYRIAASAENIRVNLDWERGASLDDLLGLISRQLGLSLREVRFSDALLDPWCLPVIIEFKSGLVAVIEKIDRAGKVSVQFSSDEGLASALTVEDLAQNYRRVLVLRPENLVSDVRVDEYVRPYQANWFWGIVLKDWKHYVDIVIASLAANVLALAAMLFSMQVYDRVIPAQSTPTLWVLAGGVGIAFIFEYVLRIMRVHISDLIGKKADLQISDRVFGHALRIKNIHRPKSTGSFISQIRELEQVREMLTSTTLSALSDLPFYFLFLAIFWLIGGQEIWIPLAALPLIFIPGLLAQIPLAKLSVEGMRESSIRNALLVEAVQGIDDIKMLRAEPRFQNQWNHVNNVSAEISKKQRFISNQLMTWSYLVQNLVYVLVILVGSFSVINGEMTTGALVACSILASRMVGPLSNITGLFVRLQQAKVAQTGLNELMQRPVDQAEDVSLLHRPVLHGHYQLQQVLFKYSDEDIHPVLAIKHLQINAGERIAILGKNGAGKSTLLQLLSGIHQAQAGQVILDNLDISLIDPSDVRRDVGMLSQQGRLFFGSIRENLTLGMPLASEQTILHALQVVGLLGYVQSRKEGLDYLILEGGDGLSGGQKQALLLARTLIREPNILLLDEPTAWLDEVGEKRLIDHFKTWLGHRTFIVATHRMAMLSIVDRIIVVNEGQIIMDGPKEKILAQAINKPAQVASEQMA
ncbi:RTX-I toxin determinant B [Legionella massiliensis]|uniref:RTX-I toxin determinant B n=1 Tax=Legionella massiliensis TaxID=1034943 RepID=A0A078KSV2_9GAMM|nr:type I secretion system permease/ATPase [Legionella massiliensis]CDZ76027.1 RTX-I toxin determinant B [Legionella massiliensis]CEE11765.1 Toxin RTX-I translocation ATP-binding protein [Legionella massiliensis]